MTNAVTEIRRLNPGDWWILRDTRLRALIDTPHAFTSWYDCEKNWPREEWRRRMDAGSWVIAADGRAVVGIAGLVDGHPGEPQHVESIWVAPAHRRLGVFRSLLNCLIDIARESGLDWLPLWVLDDNLPAREVYERLGFVWKGERKPARPGWHRHERRLWLPI